jgi:signal transduction histidine kinase/CheY-like chemotaxis protein
VAALRRRVTELERENETYQWAADLLALQNQVLEAVAAGLPTPQLLDVLIGAVEELSPRMIGSVMVTDESGTRLLLASGPRLPASYKSYFDAGLPIGPTVGSCGTAAYRKETVIVRDIASDPLWAGHTEKALPHRLLACWSSPILSPAGEVLGTFAMYYQEPRGPGDRDLQLIQAATHLASIALDRDRGERARRLLEEQARQSQKMEAVGRLAGGIAHDFNNILMVINGYGEMALEELPEGGHARELLGEVLKAGRRAASLTRQLLDYGRKQVVQPVAFDLNARVAELAGMLRRLIRDDIEVRTELPVRLGEVKADPGQVEQALINLAVNAQDAMPAGGRLTITTARVELGERHPEVRPGPYAVLTVADTGVGMTEEVRRQVFEPFFTTKPVGQGTGLGLAQVYGIARQAGGHVEVESRVGQGTIFRLYLPLAAGQADRGRQENGVEPARRGSETVLVADDDAIRSLTCQFLRGLGYRVLEAGDGAEAMRIGEQHQGPIHIFVADVRMPRASGREAAEVLQARRPGLKVLYMSGYPNDAEVRHGVEEAELNFLPKPFTPAVLAKKVRDVLDSPTSPRAEPATPAGS